MGMKFYGKEWQRGAKEEDGSRPIYRSVHYGYCAKLCSFDNKANRGCCVYPSDIICHVHASTPRAMKP